jgi:hypothetical protein
MLAPTNMLRIKARALLIQQIITERAGLKLRVWRQKVSQSLK